MVQNNQEQPSAVDDSFASPPKQGEGAVNVVETIKAEALKPLRAKDAVRENRVRVRDFVEALPERLFNMADWRRDFVAHPDAPEWVKRYALGHCGTVGCIAGWGELALGVSPGRDPTGRQYQHNQIRLKLGLDRKQAEDLFFPDGVGPLHALTKAQAIRAGHSDRRERRRLEARRD